MLVNLTPDNLNLRTEGGSEIEIVTSGQVARVNSTPGGQIGLLDGIPLYESPHWGEVEGIPAPEPGKMFIVSALVAARVSRTDVVSPGTGPQDGAIRIDGRIVAITRLISSFKG